MADRPPPTTPVSELLSARERNRRSERIAGNNPEPVARIFHSDAMLDVDADYELPKDPRDWHHPQTLCDVLARTPVGDGLSLLTIIVETAGLGDPRPPNLRPDAILPAKLATVPTTAPSHQLALFSTKAPKQGTLPELELDRANPALPLVLYDLENRGLRGRSPAASMALRMFIESVLTVMQSDFRRASLAPVALSVSLREFLTWFYGKRRARPHEYWPVLNRAAEALDRNDARLEWYNPVTGEKGRRRIVTVSDIPRGPGHLDDVVTLTVFLPPGTKSGPAINRPRLRYWGRKSEAAYRAMLSLAYRWFQPGVTRVPVNRRRSHWVQVDDPSRYTPLTEADAIALCYPHSVDQDRAKLARRAWATLRELAEQGDARLVGQRILPPKPTE